MTVSRVRVGRRRGAIQIHLRKISVAVTGQYYNVAIGAGLCDRSWDFMNYSGCTRGLADAEGNGVHK